MRKNGIHCKHFQAWERRSEFVHAQVHSHAKASSAKRFLIELIGKVPFEISSIQVDGESEFMAEFEITCQDLNIEFIVLPLSKTNYNSGGERGIRTIKEEFYYRNDILVDSIGAIRNELKKSCALI